MRSSFRAYCFLRKSKRTFTIDNVFALVPVIERKSGDLMPLIPGEAIPKFENMIYLPMIISVLERDREVIEISSFKLKGPYTKLIEGALKAAKTELKETNSYARRNNMKVIKGKNDGTFTDYTFSMAATKIFGAI